MSNNLLTTSDIQVLTGEPWHVVNYAIKRHGPAPRARIGVVRCWLASDLPAIEQAIAQTRADRPQHKAHQRQAVPA